MEHKHWLTIIGIGDDGWEGLGPKARKAIEEAQTIIGGRRHIDMLPAGDQKREIWPSPIKPYLDEFIKRKDEQICVLASGDPMFYGVGSHLARRLAPEEMRIIPHISTFAIICARMRWPETETVLVTACGRPVEQLHPELFDKARIVLYSAGSETPAEAAALLTKRGFGESLISVFEHVGGRSEKRREFTAAALTENEEFAALNSLAIECIAGKGANIWAKTPGLPEAAFDTDGQITKRDVRAPTLARLSPRPGELLWDIGSGSGSIAIEWMRAAHAARAIAIEARADRAARIARNASQLGVPKLQIAQAKAPEALHNLAPPDAIFIGGGVTKKDMIETCWNALKPGGRLVANTVTLESEQVLFSAQQKYGGQLVQISISHAAPIGGFSGWKPARPVTQWSITKE